MEYRAALLRIMMVGGHAMVTRTYQVPDVSCQHCVRAITEELRKIPGIQEIEVDLAQKIVRVVSDEQVPEEAIRNGIEAAGYTIAASAG